MLVMIFFSLLNKNLVNNFKKNNVTEKKIKKLQIIMN